MTAVRYTLSMARPSSHLFRVRIELRDHPGGSVDFVIPVWTPGSYKVRDFARNVQDFSAGGRPWRKVDKSRWRVQAGPGTVSVEYSVWAFELTVDTSHLDADHALVNGASVFMYVDGRKDAPVELDVRPPAGWRTATGLDRKGRFYRAADYDVLVDSPLEIGRFRERSFKVRGVPHRLVVHGEGNVDEARLVRDIAKVVAAEIRVMRHVPYRRYTFILHNTVVRGGGGLEHLNSTCLQYPPTGYRPREKYLNFMELVAHEFWHLWNVKRIRPEMLGPFDYEREVYTTLLWVMEGVTSYYDTLIPCRAKIATAAEYLKRMAERIQKHEEKPGRRRQSLSESSFDAWVKLYQASENAVNCQMSYYEKGDLVGMCLDLEIRRRTENRRSLDDVMRALYDTWGRRNEGFPEGEFKRTCEEAAGGTLDRFWTDYVDGTADVPWGRFLGHAGLRLEKEVVKPGEGEAKRRERTWLGITAQRTPAGGLAVASVLEGSPAWEAGLSARDELVAFDGAKAEPEGWEKRIEEREPGDRMRVSLFRDGLLREIPVTLGRKPNTTLRIVPSPRATPVQKRIYEGWTGRRWEEPKKPKK